MRDEIDWMNEEARKLEAETRLLQAKRDLRNAQQPWRIVVPVVISGLVGIALVLVSSLVTYLTLY